MTSKARAYRATQAMIVYFLVRDQFKGSFGSDEGVGTSTIASLLCSVPTRRVVPVTGVSMTLTSVDIVYKQKGEEYCLGLGQDGIKHNVNELVSCPGGPAWTQTQDAVFLVDSGVARVDQIILELKI